GRLANLHAAVLNRQAAECDALIGRERRVALNDRHGRQRNRQLFGGDLRHRSPYSGAEIDLARIHRYATVGIDGEKTIDLIGRNGFLRCRLTGSGSRARWKRERDDERSAGFQEIAASDVDRPLESLRLHRGLLQAVTSVARLIARTMRTCVPQRHKFSASAALISCSEGFLLVCSNAAACMIIPLMQ